MQAYLLPSLELLLLAPQYKFRLSSKHWQRSNWKQAHTWVLTWVWRPMQSKGEAREETNRKVIIRDLLQIKGPLLLSLEFNRKLLHKDKSELCRDQNQLLRDLSQLLNDLNQLLKDLNQLLRGLNQLLKDLNQLLRGLNQLLKDLNQLLKDLNLLHKGLYHLHRDLNQLHQDRS